MFLASAYIERMSQWTVVEGALARLKPARDQAWLAKQLGVTEQAVSNWKSRGVPTKQYRKLSSLVGLSLDQIEGLKPPPWESAGAWPFPDIDRSRWDALTEMQQGEIQAKVMDLLADIERRRGSGSGKFASSQQAAPRNGQI